MAHRPRTGPAVTLGQSWYDEDGNLAKVQRPRGNRLEFRRDQKNKDPLRRSNVVEMRRFPAGSGSPLVTRMNYGDFNQVVETQAPDGAVTTCQLDKHGLVQKVVHPAVTLETGPPVSAETKIKWNRYGQPVEFLDAAGRRTSIAYYASGGGAGLPKTQELNGRTTASFRYDTLGRLEESHDLAGVATVFEYDELDQLVKVSEPSVLDTAVKYEYDPLGQLVSQIDAAGRLISQTTRDSAGKNVERITTLRDAAGQVRHLNREGLHATDYDYDQTGQLTEVREGKPASSADVSAWLPSAASAAPDPKEKQTDLTKLISNLGPGNSPQTTTKFKYDRAGNREQVDRSGDGQATRTKYLADSANRYTQIDGQLQKYDAAGNQIDDGRFQFRYDAFNQLVRVIDAQTGKDILRQSHDPLGRVSKRWIDGSEETLTWDDAELLQTESATGTGSARTTSLRLFIPGLGIDEPIAEIDSAGTHFLHPDPMSSVVAVSDGKGSITERFHFDAFGQQAGTFDAKFKPQSPSTTGRARFQGREQLGSLPYLDFRSRVYSPGHGRFLQTDPIGLAGDPNLYRFGMNNPLLYADPMGTDPVQRGMGGGGNGSVDPNTEFLRYMQRPSWGQSRQIFKLSPGVTTQRRVTAR
ncbi:MAG: RHS repeat-associated protein [Planctomycetaceae bacterium]|jgi:RHS repeat-associated protein